MSEQDALFFWCWLYSSVSMMIGWNIYLSVRKGLGNKKAPFMFPNYEIAHVFGSMVAIFWWALLSLAAAGGVLYLGLYLAPLSVARKFARQPTPPSNKQPDLGPLRTPPEGLERCPTCGRTK